MSIMVVNADNFVKPTNNLMSNIMSAGSKFIEPTVGMGASIAHYTDRDAATVIEVFDIRGVKHIVIQEDNAKRTDSNGMSDAQDYEYTANPDGRKYTYRLRNGRWEGVWKNPKTNRWSKNDHGALILGRRDKFHDFSF